MRNTTTHALMSGAISIALLVAGLSIAPPARAAARHRIASLSRAMQDNRSCKEVAQDAWLACGNGAQEEYWLANARCDNAPALDTKRACPKAATDDLKSARMDCAEQRRARLDVCAQLGGGKYNPVIDPADFSTVIDNPYSPLVPGTKFVYEGDTPDGHEVDVVEVTHDTRVLLGVECVAVRDTSTLDGELAEDTTDWFAQDRTGNVWYFGEESKQFEDGSLVGIEGSWRAGVDGAQPGIVMEANPSAGDVYRQEFAIGEAEDMADVVGLGESVSVPYVTSSNALHTHEFSPLEPSASEQKFYVPNVGFVLSTDDETGERLELVSISP